MNNKIAMLLCLLMVSAPMAGCVGGNDESNPDNEVYLVPRVNTVDGLTDEHISKWGWNVNDSGWVNWPDYQWRIYKNSDDINWVNKVHEKLEGFKTYAPLPQIESMALYHPKDIERQEKQNEYYDTL